MKTSVAILLFIFFFLEGHSQKIKNLDFRIEGTDVIINYSLQNLLSFTDISCYYTLDNGITYHLIENAKGAIGKRVISGKNKEICWNALKDVKGINGNMKIKLIAAPSGVLGYMLFDINKSVVAAYTQTRPVSIIDVKALITKVEREVNQEIELWQQKGRYEKMSDYRMRVNDATRRKKIEELTQQKLNYNIQELFKTKIRKIDYDADNEIFRLSLIGPNPVYFKVPIAKGEAESFDKNSHKLMFSNLLFTITPQGDIALMHCTVTNVANAKTYYFDSQDLIRFNNQDIITTYGPVKVNIYKEFETGIVEGSSEIFLGKSDVDLKIPENVTINPNIYALIIGNEDYASYQTNLSSEVNVDYAENDAAIFKEYLIKTMGVPEKNISYKANATSAQMRQMLFKLATIAEIKEGEAELIFYYSGHGLPLENTQEAALIPVDVSGSNPEAAIRLEEVYTTLTSHPVQRATVFLDACFSGGARNQPLVAMRQVRVPPKPTKMNGNLVVFSSSTGEESSGAYHEKQHGMFTYFLLKKLQETKGDVTYKEMSDYIYDAVRQESVLVNNKIQTPQTHVSESVLDKWEGWTLK